MLFLMTLSIAVFCIPPTVSVASSDDEQQATDLVTVAVLEQAPVFQKDYYLNAEDEDVGQMETITGNTGNIYSYSLKKVGEIRKTDFQLMAVQLNNVDAKGIIGAIRVDYGNGCFRQRV